MKKLKLPPWFELKYRIRKRWDNITWYVRAPIFFIKKVWWFRKELWNFARWDFDHNLAIFERSLELTAEFFVSDDPVVQDAKDTALQIREFLNDLRIQRDPWKEAEKKLGFPPPHIAIDEQSYDFEKNLSREEKLKRDMFYFEIQRLEDRHWEKAWKDFAKNAKGWWE